MVIPIILYIILNKIKIKYVIIFLGIIFVSVIPFSLYQYSEPHPPLVHKYYKPSGLNKIACFWFKDKCRFLTINKIESEFPAINSHESRFYSYFSYLFLGEGRGYSERKIIDGKVLAPITIFWNNAEIDNNVYKLYFLLSLFGLFHLRLHMKKFLLMFITFLSFFIVYGSYKWQIFIYMMQIESIVVIPLVAYGTYMIARRFPKNINLIFIIIITIILISPFFTQNHIRDYSDYSMFNKNNKQTILDWWSNPFCGVPLTEIEPYCKLIANKIKES